MSFGTRLKERREALGITQPQLAELLGVSKGAVGNYETDLNSPRATILYKVFDVLQCDANYLFQDEMKVLDGADTATPEEFETIIKKYRALDERGKEIVSAVLEIEYRHVTQNHIVQFAARGGGLQSTETNASDADIAAALDELEDDISDNL